MIDYYKNIITTLPKDATVYLSNFAPVEILQAALAHSITVKLLPCDLKGFVDKRAFKPCNPNENAHIIAYPFLGSFADEILLSKLESSHCFTLCKTHAEKAFVLHEQTSTYEKLLKNSKDFDLSDHQHPKLFPVYLRPHLFCPKDLILEALDKKGISYEHTLKGLYQHPYFEKEKAKHATAHECSLSYLALCLEVSTVKAQDNAQALLDVLSHHSLRQCSF